MPEPVIYGNVNRVLGIVTEAAKQHGKLAALTEAGYEGIPDSTWWTEAFGRR
jgi:mannan endo-1,4-beta-mannosidase